MGNEKTLKTCWDPSSGYSWDHVPQSYSSLYRGNASAILLCTYRGVKLMMRTRTKVSSYCKDGNKDGNNDGHTKIPAAACGIPGTASAAVPSSPPRTVWWTQRWYAMVCQALLYIFTISAPGGIREKLHEYATKVDPHRFLTNHPCPSPFDSFPSKQYARVMAALRFYLFL